MLNLITLNFKKKLFGLFFDTQNQNFTFKIDELYKPTKADNFVARTNSVEHCLFEPYDFQEKSGDSVSRLSNFFPYSATNRTFKIPINQLKNIARKIKSSSKNTNYWECQINGTIIFNLNKIHYISADRLGPQDFYFKSTLPKFPNVGLRGELTGNLLYRKKDQLVNDKLCLGEDAKTLIIQTQEWLNKIFDGAKVEISGTQTNILELMFNASLSKDRFRPANIGFGYHCILPIIVSGLIAQEGEILIVENPEAHLHPKAQSELAKFLAKVSSCGVQVLIESHSDHILNGLRIAVLDEILSHEDLSILYFSQKIGESVVQIPVHSDGKIEEWPEGFFLIKWIKILSVFLEFKVMIKIEIFINEISLSCCIQIVKNNDEQNKIYLDSTESKTGLENWLEKKNCQLSQFQYDESSSSPPTDNQTILRNSSRFEKIGREYDGRSIYREKKQDIIGM